MISEWVRDLFRTIDRMDPEAFAAFLTEDGAFTFANQPQVRGRAAAADAVRAFFSSIAGLRHELLRQWSDSASVVVEGRVTYTRKDGTQVTLPFVDVFDSRGQKVSDYRIYMDLTPLFAPPA